MSFELANYICCPKCKFELRKEASFLFCGNCNKKYEIRNEIPILIDLDNLPKHLQKQIKYFENESGEDFKYNLDNWQEKYVQRFSDNFGNIENKTIIDCGTGSGYMAIELARLGARIIACDLTLKSLVNLKDAAGKLNLSDKITIVCCSAEELPFKKDIADYFISNAVLEHLPKEKKAIREMGRVCKKEAGIMVAMPLSYKYLNPILLPINFIHDLRIGHLRRYDRESVVRKLKDSKVIRVYYTGHFVKVFKSLANIFVNIFDKEKIETEDSLKENKKWWASNIVCFLRKQ